MLARSGAKMAQDPTENIQKTDKKNCEISDIMG